MHRMSLIMKGFVDTRFMVYIRNWLIPVHRETREQRINKGASQSSNDMLAEAADRQCSTGREQESIAVIAPSSHVR